MISISQYRMAVGTFNSFCTSRELLQARQVLHVLYAFCLVDSKRFSCRTLLFTWFAGIQLKQTPLMLLVYFMVIGLSSLTGEQILVDKSFAQPRFAQTHVVIVLHAMVIASLAFWHLSRVIAILLTLSADVELNPGPTQGGLSVYHLNARSVLSDITLGSVPHDERLVKLDEIFHALVYMRSADIITISESFLGKNISDADIALPDYQLFRKDRDRRGGGVLVFVHNSLSVSRRADLENNNIEALWLELALHSGKLFLGTYYRPPGDDLHGITEFMTALQDSIDRVFMENPKSLLLLGDFNDKCLHFDGDHHDSELKYRLVNFVNTNNLFQLIKAPTRITKDTTSLLDLIITDSPGYIMESGVLPPMCKMDHCTIYCKLKIISNRGQVFKRKIYSYSRADYISLRRGLAEAPWHVGFDIFDDINDTVDYWCKLFMESIDHFIPNKTITVRPKDKEWMTPNVRRLLNKRDRLYRKFSCSNLDQHFNNYTAARLEARLAIDMAKNEYYSRLISRLSDIDTLPKEYYKICKRLYQGKTNFGIPPLIENDQTFADSKSKANIFNEYFAANSTLPEVEQGFALPPLKYVTDARLTDINFTPFNVYKILKELKIGKANGPDQISNKMLKETAEVICQPLSQLFNMSLVTATFPDCWKRANVSPVFKKNDKQRKENYRPISLLSCVGKVMERIIYNELYEYCISNNLLTWRNSGFKSGDSTVNQLIHIVQKIYSDLEVDNDVLMIFLDVAKAFDRVYHRGLLHKLESFGVCGSLLKWFESYLDGRYQRVVINGQNSDWNEINAGVPQGSILGPLLFLIFVNDIVDDLKSDPFLYADDTSLYHVLNDRTCVTNVNDDLMKISMWANQWRVTFNAAKTVYMIISKKINRPAPLNLIFNDIQIKQVATHCHLGLHLNDSMTWDNHVNHICTGASVSVNLLKRMSKKVDRKTKLHIYRCFIRPRLEYANVVYGNNLTQAQVDTVENVQRQALLCCTGAYQHTSHVRLLQETATEPLVTRRKYFRLCQLYKLINGMSPIYLAALRPPYVHEISLYPLRNSMNLYKPKIKKNYMLKSFLWSAVDDWNRLVLDVRQSASLTIFKKCVKSILCYELHPWFDLGAGKGAVNHARLRMGLSGLNAHRKKYNFIPDNTCPKCGIKPEDETHYLVKCPAYAIHRAVLLGTVIDIVENCPDLNVSIPPRNKLETVNLATLLLKGSSVLSFEKNTDLFKAVQSYIVESNRFI